MLPLVNDAYLTLAPYQPGKPVAETLREYDLKTCIKLASNENCYGASPRALQALQAACSEVAAYPDANGSALKERLAAHLNVSPAHLLLGNGTNELLEIIARTCLRPAEAMLFANPSFVAYKLIAQAMGTPIIEVPLRAMRYDLPALLQATTANTKLLFVANPNNPTGTYVGKDELQSFLNLLPPQVLVVLDEAYLEYATAADYPDGLAFLAQRERLLITRTFSKAYGLAGLRMGYAVGQPALIDLLNRGRQPFNVSNVAQAAAMAALDDKEHIERTVRCNREERQKLTVALAQRGLHVVPSQANFVLVDLQRDGGQAYEALLRQGVIVRPMRNYGLPTWQRITVGTAAQNTTLLAALDTMLNELPAANA